MSLRSTTGCYTCKRRKKKCDETHPKCQRCARAGLECAGYAPLDSPDKRGVMRRARVPAAPPPSASSNGSANPSQTVSSQQTSSSRSRNLAPDILPLTEDPVTSISGQPRYGQAAPLNARSGSALVPGTSRTQLNLPSSLDLESNLTMRPATSAQLPDSRPSTGSFQGVEQQTVSSSSSSERSVSTRPSSSYSTSELPQRCQSSPRSMHLPVSLTSGQASLFQALFSLAETETDLTTPSGGPLSSAGPLPRVMYGPIWPPPNLSAKTSNDQYASIDEDDPEGIGRIMCKTVTPDPNTPNNALPFVLQCYARWVNLTVFDPLRVVDSMRDNVIAQFSSSQESRTRIILISNVIGTLGKSSELSAKGLSFVAMLRTETHKGLELFHSSKLTGNRDADRHEASKTLEHMLEMIMIHRYSSPLSIGFKLLEAAAPVFRRACLESPRELVNLPRILLEPGLNLRNFAVTDVITSVTTARPMLFRYDVTYTPEMDDRMTNGRFGLQWLHGVPDQFIISLAWINGLYEDFGTAVDPQYVADIEEQVRRVKIIPIASHADPFFAVWRLVVQECWRQTLYMYLYMVLCGARADEPRVLKAVRTFTQLMDGVRPGKNPDSFLFIPIMVAGACAHETRDREIVRRRMLGLRECTTLGTCGHDCLLILLDIWKRTEEEKRPAVWRDLRIARLKVTGV